MEAVRGRSLHGYRLLEEVGATDLGIVYRAFQEGLSREVAVKVIRPHYANRPHFIRRFEGEARSVAALEHLYIVPLYDYWRDPEGAYFVTRWMRGGSIADALRRQGAFTPQAATSLLDHVATALRVAHANGIIHGHIKPSNILLDEDGNAYLADFGFARIVDLPTADPEPAATNGAWQAFLAPEQLRREPLTPETDTYALGLTLYVILGGRLPTHAASLRAQTPGRAGAPLPPLSTLDSELAEQIQGIIGRATAPDPRRRYGDPLALAAALCDVVATPADSGAVLLAQLTPRELDILKRLAAGLSNREIADELVISVSTVKWYNQQIYDKLDVANRVQAGLRARQLRLFDQPGPAPTSSLPQREGQQQEAENPYKGLLAFQAADRHDFFGREQLVEQLLEKLRPEELLPTFLAIVGPSGSGKSSIVRAGLLPALWDGRLPGSECWYTVEILPGTHPLDALEVGLAKVATRPAAEFHDQLLRDERGLVRAAALLLPDKESRLLLVIDQFEEIFTLVADEAQRRHFLNLLATAAKAATGRVTVVITLRADYYDRPLRYPDFGALLRAHMVTVLPLSAEEMERAIAGPADRAQVSFDDGLVTQIVAEMSDAPGALPLLQYALTELFEQREGNRLTLDAYRGFGGAGGALAHQADALFTALDNPTRALTRQVFLRLVSLGAGTSDTRRRVHLVELRALSDQPDLVDEIVETFARHRLLTLDHDAVTRQPTVELAHEALLQEWQRLHHWLDTSRSDIRMQRLLARAAEEWRAADHDSSFLLRGSRLQQFDSWAPATALPLTVDERAFLDASRQQRMEREEAEAARQGREMALVQSSARRLRALVAVLAGAALLALILSLFAFDRSRRFQRESTVNRSLVLAANAEREYESGFTDVATALALEAAAIDNPPAEVVRVLYQIARSPATRYVLAGHAIPTTTIGAVAITPDSHLAVSGANDGSLVLWNLDSGKEERRFAGHRGRVWDLAFSPDGTLLASAAGSFDHPEDVLLWDVHSGAEAGRLPVARYAQSLAFSPDGRYLLVGPGGNWEHGDFPSLEQERTAITLWNVPAATITRTFTLTTAGVSSLQFAADGKTFVSGSFDETAVRLWDLATGEVVTRYIGHSMASMPGATALFRPDGRSLISTGDYRLNLWSIDGRLQDSHQSAIEPTALSLHPGGQVAAFAEALSNSWILWDISSWGPLQRFSDHGSDVTATAISPDGRLAVTGAQDGTVRVWDLNPHDEVRRFEAGIPLSAVAVSADGNWLLTGDMAGTTTLWDVNSGELIRRYVGGRGPVLKVAISPDGQTIAVAAGDFWADATVHSLDLWDVATGERLHTLSGYARLPRCLAFSPDGRTLLAGSQASIEPLSGDLNLWDVASGTLLRRFDTTEDVTAIAFTADGQRAVTSSGYFDNVTVWDVATGKARHGFSTGVGLVYDMALSPDEQMVLTASDNGLTLWDLATGSVIHHLVGHREAVMAAAFSPDGTKALSAGEDGVVFLWNVGTGEELRRFTGHEPDAIIPGVAFSPDASTAFSVAGDGRAIQWQIAQPDVTALIGWIHANRYVRPFTCAERARFAVGQPCE